MKLIQNNPKDASAIIIFYKKKVLLQKRDKKNNIFYPNFWGLFGGAKNFNETYKSAAIREMMEEIGYQVNKKNLNYFFKLDIEFPLRKKSVFIKRYFYTYEVFNFKKFNEEIKLKEGSACEFFSIPKINKLRVTPYDKFALDMFNDLL